MTIKISHFATILNKGHKTWHSPNFPKFHHFHEIFSQCLASFYGKSRNESLTGCNRHHDIFQPFFSLRIGFKLCSNFTCWRWNCWKLGKSLRISWKNVKFFSSFSRKQLFSNLLQTPPFPLRGRTHKHAQNRFENKSSWKFGKHSKW